MISQHGSLVLAKADYPKSRYSSKRIVQAQLLREEVSARRFNLGRRGRHLWLSGLEVLYVA